MRSIRLIRCLPWLSAILFAAACTAQVMQQPGTMPGRTPAQGHEATPAHPSAAGAAAAPGAAEPSAESSPALPPSLLDKPAQPAQVTLDNGLLAIHADNSSLSGILRQISASTGMSVEGFQHDQRIFGVYGPGNPRDVLSGLLQDAGYNFLLAGSTDKGTPKEILLTALTGGGATSVPAQAQPDDASDDDDSDNSGSNSFPMEAPTPDRSAPPGAATPAANPDGRVKTPAEIIQELQRLRQQQENPQ